MVHNLPQSSKCRERALACMNLHIIGVQKQLRINALVQGTPNESALPEAVFRRSL